MDHSIFRDGVLVDQVILQRVESSKSAEILRDRVDLTSRGVSAGGLVTVNALDLTRVDVADLSGYTPSGEYISTGADYYSLVLDDYTLGVENYVIAYYTESNLFAMPHETDGHTYATYAKVAWRIRVVSAANYALLPATDPNLLNDAKDRALIVAVVTANGPLVNLTSSNIFSPTSYDALLYSDPMTFTTIPGVTVLAVSTDSTPGAGALEHYCLGGPVQYLRWQAPNMAVWLAPPPGAPPGFGWVEITTDGNYSLPGSTGTYITVQVILSMLPSVIATLTSAAATIYDIYFQSIPRQTSEDFLHRSLLGSGILAPNNPHALSISDLSGSDLGLLAEHIDTQHGNGFLRISSPSCAQATISFPLTADSLNLVPMTGVDAYLCNGKRVTTFAPTSFMFEPAVIPSSTSGSHTYEVLLSDEGVASVNHKAMVDESGGPRIATGIWIVGFSENYPAGAYDISLTVGATYSLRWDSGEPVTVLLAAASQVVRLFAADSEKWVDVYINTDTALISADGNLPGAGVYVDSVIVYATPDPTQNLLISTLCGWLDAGAAPPRFGIGFPPYGISREVVDTRPWGTLDTANISDACLQEIIYSSVDELHESGVLYRRNTLAYDFVYYGAAGLSISVRGGGLYCRGKRLDFAGATQVLYDNKTNLLYIDAAGSLRLLNVTDDFAGSIPNAVAYVIGGTRLLPWASDVYHGDVDDPERGVVLYSIVTAGGAIVSYTNLMRNINDAVDPWSVSDFRIVSYMGSSVRYLSAFDSLYSAFLYAGLRTRSHKIEVKINGISYVDQVITQPENVDVCGKCGTNPDVIVTVVDAAGAWRLSAGCKVTNTSIITSADGAVILALNNNAVVERCIYASTAATNDIFLYADAGSAYSNVHVKENKCSTHSSFLTAINAGNYSWWVSSNTVSQSSSSIVGSLIRLYGKNIYVKNNKLITNNSVTSTPAISGTPAGEYLIDGNDIEVGTSADAVLNYGIRMISSSAYIPQIINNTIKRVAGSVSHVGIGIYVEDGGAIIRGNSIAGMGGGIFVSSNALPYTQIEGNAVGAGYHFGIQVSTHAGSWTVADDITLRGNTVTGLTKNAGGVALFGNDLQGIWLQGGIVAGISAGNMIISDNTVTSLTTAINDVYGIFAEYSFALGGISSYDGISINGNSIKTVAATAGGGTAFGVNLSFSAAAPGVVSLLDCRALSVSSNNIRGVLSVDENAYALYCNINLDSGHTTGLNGLAVNGNNVAGFWGDITDTTSVSAGIHIDGPSSFDDVLAVTCNNNNVASNSLMVAGAVHNDDTFVYGIYNNLTNSVISNNNISFTGLATTVRGDGIRCFPKGTALPTLKSVISGNSIDVNWSGIHIMGDGVSCTFDVSGNRINTKSVGVYMDSNVILSSISNNVVYSAPLNACFYPGCTLTGGGCIVGRTSWPMLTSINGNNLTLSGSVSTFSANVWLNVSSGVSVDNNRSYRFGGIVGAVYHLYLLDCVGACSVSGNTVDNSVAAGASGIVWSGSAATFTNCSIKNNSVLASNLDTGLIYEFQVVAAGGFGNHVFVLGNTLHLINAGAGNYAKYQLNASHIGGGQIVNTFRTTGVGAYIFANSTTNDLAASPIVDF